MCFIYNVLMALSLKNKKVLITGSTSGLGRLTAINLAQLGAQIHVHGRDQEKINNVRSELTNISKENNFESNHKGIHCDLNKPDDVTKAFNDIDALDILINNAGVWLEGATLDANSQKIIELVNVNLLATLLTSRLLLSKLQQSSYGQILNVISVAGYEVPSDYYHTIYSATKYGLQGFSEAMAKEFEGKNLRVMGYYPGGMDTQLFKKAGMNYKEHEDWMFDPQESVDAIIFMLTRNQKISVKRMDLITQLFN